MMKRLLFLSAIVTLLCWATGTAQTETGTARGPFSDKLPEDDLAIVSYHVEERIATIYGPHITTYNVQDPRYISRIELGPGNVRLIVPKFAKIRKREPSLVVMPAKVATGSVLPSTSTELAARALPSGAVHKAGYAYINIIRTYERILAKGYKSVDMLKKVADQRFFDGDLEIAAGWYAKLFDITGDLDEIYYYRYAASLKAVGQARKSDELMAIFENKRAQGRLVGK